MDLVEPEKAYAIADAVESAPPSTPPPASSCLGRRSAGGIKHAPILWRVRLPLLALARRSSIGRDSILVECSSRSPSAKGK